MLIQGSELEHLDSFRIESTFVYRRVLTATTNLTYLNDIGVSFNRYGILTIDERLGSALSSKCSDIVSIFFRRHE